jgi:hypothetical protein
LQQWLDGRTRECAPVPSDAPALCPACSDWVAAARRLDRGLRQLTPPAPPPRLADRIVARLAGDHRRRRYRLLFAAGAAAAAAVVVIAVWHGFHGATPPAPIPVPAPFAKGRPDADPPPAVPVSLRDSVASAGSAVASLTSRTADETMEKTKLLLPVMADPSLSKIDLQRPIAEPTRTLREAGEGVSTTLEPVADSARRAVGLFLRELPPMDGMPKGGL